MTAPARRHQGLGDTSSITVYERLVVGASPGLPSTLGVSIWVLVTKKKINLRRNMDNGCIHNNPSGPLRNIREALPLRGVYFFEHMRLGETQFRSSRLLE